MHNPSEKFIHIEDQFDLEDLKNRARSLKRKNALLRKYKKISKLLLILSGILLLSASLAAVWLFSYYLETNKAAQTNEKASEISNSSLDYQTVADEKIYLPPTVEEAGRDVVPLPVIEEDEKNEVIFEKTANEKIINLKEAFKNDDIVGYLQIDNTNIDYAVAQASDNKFYLNHDLYGKKSAAGSIFMDYESDASNLSRNIVIYGHNMRDGSMFHNLRYFTDPEYFEERRFIKLTTLYEETIWEIFSFYETTTDFYYIQVIFSDEDSFLSLVSEMKEKSLYDTGTEVGSGDKILTLSTCAQTASDIRFVLNAKLIGE